MAKKQTKTQHAHCEKEPLLAWTEDEDLVSATSSLPNPEDGDARWRIVHFEGSETYSVETSDHILIETANLPDFFNSLDEAKAWCEAREVELRGKATTEEAPSEYERRLLRVRAYQAMCDTPAWQEFYSAIKRMEADALADLQTAEKTRDIVRDQESIRICERLVGFVIARVVELDDWVDQMPLFAGQSPVRAEWMPADGTIRLVDVESKAPRDEVQTASETK